MVHKAAETLLTLLLASATAMAQTVVYQGETTPLTVVEVPGHTYKWEIYSDLTVDFAKEPGNCPVTSATFVGGNTKASVIVRWIRTGIYFYKIRAHDANNCAMNMKIGMIKVVPKEILVVLGFEETIIGACQSINLDASKSVGDNLSYEWSLIDPGGALTRTAGVNTEFYLSPSYTGSLPADFRVRLQITDPAGNSQSDTINITVDSLPVSEIQSDGKPEKDGTMIFNAKITAGKAVKYKWNTYVGQVVGADNLPSSKLLGAGIYSLETTDQYGCKSTKDFKFPVETYQIFANPDYARISWENDTTINVLSNDLSNVDFIPGSVRVIQQPKKGVTIVNPNGSIIYIPNQWQPGRDQFVYEVCNRVNLCTTATVTIDIFGSEITPPGGFSPNIDGTNEYFNIKGLENYPKSELYIYTRAGLLIYQSDDYQNNWDGTIVTNKMANPGKAPAGTYYYVLKIGGTNRLLKGFVYIGY